MSEVASEVSEELEDSDYHEDFESAHSLSGEDSRAFAAASHSDREAETQYSDDFESSLLKSVRFGGEDTCQPPAELTEAYERADISARPLLGGLLPSPGILSLQAEALMDELSKEVVRLRNEQRLVLKQRRAQAKLKKERADARRAEHIRQLNQQKELTLGLELERETLRAALREASLRCSCLEEEKGSAERAMGVMESQLEGKSAELQKLRTEVDSLSSTLLSERNKWSGERKRLSDELTRLRLTTEVVQATAALNEERLRKDRENLPEYFRKRLEDETKVLKEKERLLDERLATLKVEEERRIQMIENLRREVVKELDQGRARLEVETEETR